MLKSPPEIKVHVFSHKKQKMPSMHSRKTLILPSGARYTSEKILSLYLTVSISAAIVMTLNAGNSSKSNYFCTGNNKPPQRRSFRFIKKVTEFTIPQISFSSEYHDSVSLITFELKQV